MALFKLGAALGAALGFAALSAPVQAGPVLDKIKADGKITCLVNPNSPGFSVPDSQGVFRGFNVEFCRMAAAAIFGDSSKAEMRGIGFSDSLKALISGSAHMASRGITSTGTRDADPGVSFVVPTFFDGQGFMVPKSLGMTKLQDLSGATICAEEGSTTLLYLADWFGAAKLPYKVENIADKTARLQAFFSGKCDAVASSISALAADRLLAPKPDDYVLVPQRSATEPLALASRPDTELEKTLFWGVQIMLAAEELDITSANVDEKLAKLKDLPVEAQRLLSPTGPTADMAKKLGINPEWSVRIIKQVGSYGEVFEKHLGKASPLAMDRSASPNRLARDGGLMFAYPVR
jgi:general L-amino acid transport system substrate-binding protein